MRGKKTVAARAPREMIKMRTSTLFQSLNTSAFETSFSSTTTAETDAGTSRYMKNKEKKLRDTQR